MKSTIFIGRGLAKPFANLLTKNRVFQINAHISEFTLNTKAARH